MTCGRAGENTATMKIFMGITGSNIGGVFLTFSAVTFSISSLWARLLRFLSAWRGGSGAKVTDCWSCCTTTTSCEWPQGADFSFSFFFLWKDTNTSVLNVKDLCECVWTVVWMHWPISCDVTFEPMTQVIRAARGLQDLISSSQTNRGTAAGSDGRRTDLSLSLSIHWSGQRGVDLCWHAGSRRTKGFSGGAEVPPLHQWQRPHRVCPLTDGARTHRQTTDRKQRWHHGPLVLYQYIC